MIDFILVDTNFTTGFNIGGKFCFMTLMKKLLRSSTVFLPQKRETWGHLGQKVAGTPRTNIIFNLSSLGKPLSLVPSVSRISLRPREC